MNSLSQRLRQVGEIGVEFVGAQEMPLIGVAAHLLDQRVPFGAHGADVDPVDLREIRGVEARRQNRVVQRHRVVSQRIRWRGTAFIVPSMTRSSLRRVRSVRIALEAASRPDRTSPAARPSPCAHAHRSPNGTCTARHGRSLRRRARFRCPIQRHMGVQAIEAMLDLDRAGRLDACCAR